MRNRLIYKITNKINGKVYIGQTSQGLARRKGEHIYRFNLGERDHRLYQAMRKYGIENFEFSIVCHVLNSADLDYLEKQVIEDHDSHRNGYNMSCGGGSFSGEIKENLSRALRGRKITWYDKIIESRKANPNRKDPQEFVPKGGNNVNAKMFLVRHPDGSEEVIHGLKKFCKDYGLTFKSMYDVLDGKQNHHKGYALLARFNDHPDREYAQAGGKGADPVSPQDQDMVWSALKGVAADKAGVA